MSTKPPFRELLAPRLSGTTLDLLVLYAELLEHWSARHNLVRVANRRELVERHILDSLEASPLPSGGGLLLDVGSGAGLPGVPLLVANGGWEGVLLEPRQKRWAFLRLVIRELGLNAHAERTRYQDLGVGRSWNLITLRAVGGYGEFLRWARGALALGGEVLIWATTDTQQELESSAGWRVLSSPLSGLDRGRLVRLQPCFT